MRVGELRAWEWKDHKVILVGEHLQVEVEVFTEKIINVYVTPGPQKFFSQAVVLNPRVTEWRAEEGEEYIIVSTPCLRIKLGKSPFSLEFEDGRGFRLKCREVVWEENLRSCSWEIREGEHFYGLGEKTGFLDKRGKRYIMRNQDCYDAYTEGADAMYASIPFYIGVGPGGSYGIYLDNTFPTFFDMGKTREHLVTWGAEKGPLNFFFIYGPSVKEVVQGYTEITGRMELPPVWSLGYQQSRYSYSSQERVLEVAREFRKRGIPCDALYLDIDYMDGFRVFTFDRKRFPDPSGMIRQLGEMGFKAVAIVDPGVKVDGNYRVFREGLAKGYFITDENGLVYTGEVWPGRTCFPDFARAEVRSWWAELHREFLEMGLAGIWNDMNEPTVLDTADRTLPPGLVHNREGRWVAHEEFRNIYALNMALATREGWLKYRPQERCFILTRSGFAGIQRYAAMWTGDNRSYWEHLKMSIPMLLNMGLSGVAFCGADIGGFAEDANEELLIRWTQLGVFYPFCRNHTEVGTVDQEPWAFGARCEEICRRFIRLRYTLLPYIYNLFYEASQNGAPVFRPLVFEYESDENCHGIFDEFLLGSSILAAPVYEPGRSVRAVYLPEGKWMDWWSGEVLEGGKYYLAEAPWERMPLFVRAGAILPLMSRPVSYTEERPWEVVFHLFPGGSEGEYVFYEDDGCSLDYRKGRYNLYRLRYSLSGEGLILEWEKAYGGFPEGQKEFEVVLKNDGEVREVRVNGRPWGRRLKLPGTGDASA